MLLYKIKYVNLYENKKCNYENESKFKKFIINLKMKKIGKTWDNSKFPSIFNFLDVVCTYDIYR